MNADNCTEADFWTLTKKLAEEIQDAHFDYQLFRDLDDALGDHLEAANRSPAFWTRTVDTLQVSFVLRLSRIYEQQTAALGLGFWLTVIKKHISWFDEAAFRARAALSSYDGKPVAAELSTEIISVNPQDPIVKKLVLARNNMIAHTGRTAYVQRITNPLPGMTYGEIQTLLERAKTLLHKYTDLYNVNSWTMTQMGHGDYKFVLDAIQKLNEERPKLH